MRKSNGRTPLSWPSPQDWRWMTSHSYRSGAGSWGSTLVLLNFLWRKNCMTRILDVFVFYQYTLSLNAFDLDFEGLEYISVGCITHGLQWLDLLLCFIYRYLPILENCKAILHFTILYVGSFLVHKTPIKLFYVFVLCLNSSSLGKAPKNYLFYYRLNFYGLITELFNNK